MALDHVGYYECRKCGERAFLALEQLLPSVTFGVTAVGGASHGLRLDCRGNVWDLVDDRGAPNAEAT